MRIFFIINEAHPIYKIGGLGDVGGSLPIALSKLGVDTSIVIPRHPEIKLNNYETKDSFKIEYKNESLGVEVHQTILPGSSLPTFLIHEKRYLSTHTDASDNHADKYAVFSLAVSTWISGLDKENQPDIIHLNDWHTALIPIISTHKLKSKNLKYLITIHNLMYQGLTNTPVVKNLKIPQDSCQILSMDAHDNHINILLEGLLHSDVINTVSPTYAKEILTNEYGEKIDEILSLRKKDIVGILNGLDLETFNPNKDPNIFKNYSFSDVEKGKEQNKSNLQKELNLEQDDKKVMVGFVGRVDGGQKGIQLIIEAIEKNILVNQNQQFIFLGTGDPHLESLLHKSSENKINIRIITRYDEVLASKIYASSDLLLIPSKFEPCGLIQMIAMRYGSIPVARATGGLIDTIDDKKNGFLFKDYSVEDMTNTLQKSIKLFSDSDTKKYMIQSAMSKDFSWDQSAIKYKQLYKSILQNNI